MFSFFKKSKTPEFSLEQLEEPTIPYACHYNDQSLLTKNGELLQVIKIEGYSEEMMNSSDDVDLRGIIRKAIMENVTDRKVAIWFHTLRRKHNLDSINYFSSTFAKDTHDSWAQKNHWRDKFVNELFITILYEGTGTDKQNFALSFTPKLLKHYHLNKLAYNAQKLDEIITNMLTVLKPFGGKRLEVKHDSYGAHSEILEFLTKIICLHSKRVAIPIQSIDNIFHRSQVAFGGNAMEILDENKKHYAAIFSIKEYHELAAKALDKFLGIASEYIISQTLTFVDAAEAKKPSEYFNYILGVSKDEELRKQCGLADIIDSDKGNQNDYGTQQMNFMILGESLEELERTAGSTITELNKLGIVAVREDLNIELCFWSQLPGNFSFFRRPSYINTKNSASFASLNNNPSGKTKNPWGPAVTLFRRKDGGPHYFNFHLQKSGHTIIAGDHKSSKKTLLNLLLSESSKYDPHILYIDQNETSRVIVKALEGRHEILTLDKEELDFSFNPFHLPDTEENHQFLKDWLLLLIFPNGSHKEEQKQMIDAAIDKFITKMPVGSRQISMLEELFEDKTIKANLALWCRPNKLGMLFDNPMDEFDSSSKIIGFNIQALSSNPDALKALIFYCSYRYSNLQNSPPTIIAIDDANLLLKDKVFTDMLPKWLDKLTAKNAIAIFMWDIKNSLNENLKNIHDKISTHLLSIYFDYKFYKEAFNLTEDEISDLKKMKSINRNFMIKQKSERTIVELNLDGLEYVIKTLGGQEDALEAMDKAILKHGDNPNIWIVPFYQNLFPN